MEEYFGKDKKLYAAFMDLEKAYDRVDREALWSVLKIYGVGGELLKGIQAFYRGKWEEYIGKDKMVHAAFIYLENPSGVC